MTNMLVSETFLFKIFFNCHLLTQPFAKIHLPIATFSNWFNNLNLFLRNKEIKFDTFLCHVSFNFRLHILLRPILLSFSSLFLFSFLLFSLLFFFLFFSIRWRIWWWTLTFVLFLRRWFLRFLWLSSLILLSDLGLLNFLYYIKSKFFISKFADRITKTLAFENKFQKLNFPFHDSSVTKRWNS